MVDWLLYQFGLMLVFFIGFVAFVIFSRGRRSVSNIAAWVLFMIFMPVMAIPIFILFGQRKIQWLLHKQRQIYSMSGKPQLSQGSLLQKTLSAYGVPLTSVQNKIDLLATGEQAYTQLLTLLDNAEKSIYISTFILGNDTVGSSIIQKLAEKAEQGVKVLLLLDALGTFKLPHKNLKVLRRAGGRIAYVMPILQNPFRGQPNLRNHRKIIVVDEREGMVGGMNLANAYLGPTPTSKRWRDLAVLVRGQAIDDLVEVFLADWELAGETDMAPRAQVVTRQIPKTNDGAVQVVASGPDAIGDALYDALIAAMFSAKHRIWIVTPYFLPDQSLKKTLFLALRRGIEVRIVLPKKSNHWIADLARYRVIEHLQSAGAKILLFEPTMLHAKAIVIDEQVAIVGSANMDMRSLWLNFEISLFLYDTQAITQIVAWIVAIKADCSETLPKVGLIKRLFADASQILMPLL